MLRQGTWLTMALWVVSLALHFSASAWIDSIHGQGGVVSASLLLWLGITYGVQNAVVHRRAEGLLEAGRPHRRRAPRWLGVRLWAGRWPGPGGPRRAGAGPGARGGRGPAAHAGAIEASSEVVDDQPAGAGGPGDREARGRAPPPRPGAADPAPAHGCPVPPGLRPSGGRRGGRSQWAAARPTTARERRMSHDEHRLLIGGEWVDASGGTYDVVNPATEEVVGPGPDATADDARAAAAAARQALPGVGGHPGGRPLRPAGPGGRGHPGSRPRSSCRW